MIRVGCIYIIRNVLNNKVYIGQTSLKNPIKRWVEHYEESKNENNLLYLYKSIRKYGIENFTFQILESNIPIENLDEKETFYIKIYNSSNENFGYNLTLGGQRNKEVNLSEDDVRDIIQMIRSGYSFESISLKYRVSTSTISDINCGDTWFFSGVDYPIRLSRNRKKNFSEKEIEDIIKLLKECKSLKDIAEKYNTSINTISRINKGEIYSYENEEYPINDLKNFHHIDIQKMKKIIKLLETTDMTHKEIANCVGVTRKSVSNINTGTYHKKALDQLGYNKFPIRKP